MLEKGRVGALYPTGAHAHGKTADTYRSGRAELGCAALVNTSPANDIAVGETGDFQFDWYSTGVGTGILCIEHDLQLSPDAGGMALPLSFSDRPFRGRRPGASWRRARPPS